MSATETIKPINAAHLALLNSKDALCVDAVATATGLKKREAAKQLKQLAGLGLIEPEFRAGGVPFYRLISEPVCDLVQTEGESQAAVAPATPATPAAPAERVLTPEAQAERDQFDLEVADRGCTCFISPPCGYCTHPGNPRNQEEDETAWMTVSDSEGGETDAPAADADGWIPWVATACSFCPVPAGTFVRVRLQGGQEQESTAESFKWHAVTNIITPIIAYKIIAQAPADFATTPELQYLEPEDYEMPPADPALLAAANRALGEQLEDAKAENSELSDLNTRLSGLLNAIAVAVRGEPAPLSLHSFHDLPDRVTAAINALKGAMELAAESNDLRARLDAVTQQSVKDIGLLTEKNDKLHSEIDHLRADLNNAQRELETLRAENLALKTLEETMPGFGAEYDAQRIASLTAELQALRTSNANAINEADRLRAELDTERQAREALQEQESSERALSGYIVRSAKRKPKTIKTLGKAHDAAMSAIRAGAMRADVFALVPVGTARRGAEWRAK